MILVAFWLEMKMTFDVNIRRRTDVGFWSKMKVGLRSESQKTLNRTLFEETAIWVSETIVSVIECTCSISHLTTGTVF